MKLKSLKMTLHDKSLQPNADTKCKCWAAQKIYNKPPQIWSCYFAQHLKERTSMFLHSILKDTNKMFKVVFFLCLGHAMVAAQKSGMIYQFLLQISIVMNELNAVHCMFILFDPSFQTINIHSLTPVSCLKTICNTKNLQLFEMEWDLRYTFIS